VRKYETYLLDNKWTGAWASPLTSNVTRPWFSTSEGRGACKNYEKKTFLDRMGRSAGWAGRSVENVSAQNQVAVWMNAAWALECACASEKLSAHFRVKLRSPLSCVKARLRHLLSATGAGPATPASPPRRPAAASAFADQHGAGAGGGEAGGVGGVAMPLSVTSRWPGGMRAARRS